MDAGYLIPYFLDEALPGDTFRYQVSGFARLATLQKPIMDNMYMDTFFFAVPLRLLWDNFEKFMGAQDTPGASTSFLIPQVDLSASVDLNLPLNLTDYFGLPIKTSGFVQGLGMVNAWAFRAYNLIYNEWFRDQNLQPKVPVNLGDGPDAPGDYKLLRRGKRHDYFTSALTGPQKGPAVTIPVGVNPAVVSQGSGPTFKNQAVSAFGKQLQFGAAAATGAVVFGSGTGNAAANTQMYWDATNLAVASDALGTINQLRQAVQIQRLYEREARGGTRYTEQVRSLFGVTSDDARLQRPEYLGGGSTAVSISPVAQTGPTVAAQTPQGNLAGTGQIMWQGHGFAKSFTEHCFIMGIMCIRADMTYQRYMDRQWFRRTKLDMYLPPLANLGEQAILNKEILFQGSAVDDQVFGYQERYAEYRYKNSLITGLFRSDVPQSLDMWHLAQKFTTLPTLGPTFIAEAPPISRVVAVPSEPQFLVDTYAKYVCARPMPVFGVPGNMDRF